MLEVVWGLLKILVGLGLVLALAAASTRFLQQRLPVPQGRGHVRVLGHLYLGGRRGVSLVKVGESVLVLGVTDQAVNLLDKVTEPDAVSALEEAAAAPLVTPDQWQKVRRGLARARREWERHPLWQELRRRGKGRGNGGPGGL